MVGIRDGYNGLMMPEKFVNGGVVRLTRDSVRGITHLGAPSSARPTGVTRFNIRFATPMAPIRKWIARMNSLEPSPCVKLTP